MLSTRRRLISFYEPVKAMVKIPNNLYLWGDALTTDDDSVEARHHDRASYTAHAHQLHRIVHTYTASGSRYGTVP